MIGRAHVHRLDLAEDCIFTQPLVAARRQVGCARFCYLPPGSRTPRRFECVPPQDADPATAALAPVFTSLRYGEPGYCQLIRDCPEAIARGAGDQSELGVFHNEYNPQREENLRTRLAEYVPAAVDVDVIHVD